MNLEINFRFIFTDENLPGWIGYISRRHFSIQRETINNKVNYSPAILKVHSKNGIMVNQTLLREGSEQVLKSGDKIMLPAPSGIPLFKFFDKRDFNTAEIPQNILDRYHFDDFIGVGASGSVRKVHNFETGGKFAAKLISRAPRPNEDDEKYGKRLQHLNSEIKTMKMLIHPNVIKFIEHYSSNTQTVIIMELAESGNLLDLLNRYPNNCLPENEAKFCCYQVCKGLEYIHSKGIAHRDIKVDNVFVVNAAQGSNEFILKIGDYGYAKSVDEILSTQLGTPYYWPPEIMKKPYTQSADVWSLGCLFYACLSGTFPFYQTHEKSLEVQIASASLDFNRIEHWAEVSLNKLY